MNLAEHLARDALAVAPSLLGMRLRTEFGGEVVEVEINEVEAYRATEDPASHAYRGPTTRNRSMFKSPGTLYVYRSYGVHWCCNVVTGPIGSGEAVLIRGGVPTLGIEVAARRRGRDTHLSDGPGKLCQAMAITGSHDGSSLLSGPVRLLPGLPKNHKATTRIGISKAKDHPWRFVAFEPATD